MSCALFKSYIYLSLWEVWCTRRAVCDEDDDEEECFILSLILLLILLLSSLLFIFIASRWCSGELYTFTYVWFVCIFYGSAVSYKLSYKLQTWDYNSGLSTRRQSYDQECIYTYFDIFSYMWLLWRCYTNARVRYKDDYYAWHYASSRWHCIIAFVRRELATCTLTFNAPVESTSDNYFNLGHTMSISSVLKFNSRSLIWVCKMVIYVRLRCCSVFWARRCRSYATRLFSSSNSCKSWTRWVCSPWSCIRTLYATCRRSMSVLSNSFALLIYFYKSCLESSCVCSACVWRSFSLASLIKLCSMVRSCRLPSMLRKRDWRLSSASRSAVAFCCYTYVIWLRLSLVICYNLASVFVNYTSSCTMWSIYSLTILFSPTSLLGKIR